MKTAIIALALLALAPTAARADFNIDGFTAGMTKTETLAKLRAEGLVPKPPLIPALDDPQMFQTGPYTFSFCKNDRLGGLSKTITVKEFNAKLVETIRLRGEPRVDIPANATTDIAMDILYLQWGDAKTNDWMALNVVGPNQLNGGEGAHVWSTIDNSFCDKRRPLRSLKRSGWRGSGSRRNSETSPSMHNRHRHHRRCLRHLLDDARGCERG